MLAPTHLTVKACHRRALPPSSNRELAIVLYTVWSERSHQNSVATVPSTPVRMTTVRLAAVTCVPGTPLVIKAKVASEERHRTQAV